MQKWFKSQLFEKELLSRLVTTMSHLNWLMLTFW